MRALRVVLIVCVLAGLGGVAGCGSTTPPTPPSPSATPSPLPVASSAEVLAYLLARVSSPGYTPVATAPECADKGYPARWRPAAGGSAASLRICYRGVRYPDGRFGAGTLWVFDNSAVAQAALPMRFGKPSGDATVLVPGTWTKLDIDDFHQTYMIAPDLAASIAAAAVSGAGPNPPLVTVSTCTPKRVACQLTPGLTAAGLTSERVLDLWGKGASVGSLLAAADSAVSWKGTAYAGLTPQGKAIVASYRHRAAIAPGIVAPPLR